MKRWKHSGLELEEFFENLINSASLQRNQENRKHDEYEGRLVIDETPSKTGAILQGSVTSQDSSVENYQQQLPNSSCTIPNNSSGAPSSNKPDKQLVG